ncbi:restriction endonuclease subunit S [bacterium]|nr:restriction endonuclease subunit S [bacterium]
MKFKPYHKYKDSGIEWLGNVPEGWDAKRLKYCASINDEALPETTDPNTEIVYVDISSVDSTDGIVNKEAYVFSAAPSRARRIVREGDVIVSTVRTYLRAISPINNPESNLIVSTGFAVIRSRDGLGSKFAAHALRAPYFVDDVVARSVGVSYPAINASEIGALAIALPPLPEQRAIAAFLDRETWRIDELIRKKERQIELLQEKRRALISHAVTKGLDPNAKLKDSGIEWLGIVPEHWGVKKIKWLTPVKRGASPRPIDDAKYFDEEGERAWVRIADVTASDRYLLETTQRLSALGASLSVPIDPGSIFLSIAGTVGKPIITKIKCCIHDGFVYFPTFKENIEFLYYILASGQPYFGLGKWGTQLNLNTDTVGDISIPVPSREEQEGIVSYLDHETSRLDELAAKIRASIETLREYRTALISAAVTGKIDVRGEV